MGVMDDPDVTFEGTATRDGVTVTVSLRIEPRAQYPDMGEFGEEVGATAARIAHRVVKAKPEVPF